MTFAHFKILYTVLLLVLTFSVFRVIVFNNNLYEEYQNEVDMDSWMTLQDGDSEEADIVVRNESMTLEKVEIFIGNLKSVDSNDYVELEGMGINRKIYFSEIDPNTPYSVEPANIQEERETLHIKVQCAPKSWIEMRENKQGEIALQKTYRVCQLDQTGRMVYEVLVVLLFISTIVLIFFLVWYPNISRYGYFALMTGQLLCAMAVRDVTFLCSPEPFAEQIGTHFYYATHYSILECILTKEAGYMHFIKRIVAWFVAQSDWGKMHYVVVTNFVTLLVIAMASSIGVLRCERQEEKILAYISGLYIPLVLLDAVPNFFYIDIGYWGIFFLFYFLFLGKLEKLSRGAFAVVIVLCASFCLTQGQFVCFIPLCFIFMFWKKGRYRILHGCVVVAALIQLGMSLGTPGGRAWDKYEGFIQLCKGCFLEFPKIFYRIWGIDIWQYKEGVTTVLIIIAYLFVIGMGILVLRSKNKGLREISLAVYLLGAISLGFMGITTPHMLEKGRYDKGRYEMFLIVVIYMAICVFLVYLNRAYSGKWHGIFGIVVMVVACMGGIKEESDGRYYDKRYVMDLLCDWKNVAGYVINSDSYYIRIDPEEWPWSAYFENITEEIIETADVKKEIHGDTPLVSVYLFRTDISEPLGIRVYGEKDNLLIEKEQTTSAVRKFTGFLFDEPVQNARYVELYYLDTGEKLVMDKEIYVYSVGTDVFVPRDTEDQIIQNALTAKW